MSRTSDKHQVWVNLGEDESDASDGTSARASFQSTRQPMVRPPSNQGSSSSIEPRRNTRSGSTSKRAVSWCHTFTTVYLDHSIESILFNLYFCHLLGIKICCFWCNTYKISFTNIDTRHNNMVY